MSANNRCKFHFETHQVDTVQADELRPKVLEAAAGKFGFGAVDPEKARTRRT